MALSVLAGDKAKRWQRMRNMTSGGSEGAKAFTKKAKTDGFNVDYVVWHVSRNESNDKAPTNLTLFIKPFGPSCVDGLNKDYYQWDPANQCARLAVQRFITQEEAIAGVSQADSYPKEKEKWKWIEVRPATFLTISDFNHDLTPLHLGATGKLFDLRPRYRKDSAQGQWNWKWATPINVDTRVERLNFRALAYLSTSMPQELFFLQDQRFLQTEQGAVVLKYFPPWDLGAIDREMDLEPSIIGTWFALDDGVSTWAISPRVPNNKSHALPKPPSAAANSGKDKDKLQYTVKALIGLMLVTQTLNGQVQDVIVKVNIGAAVIEKAFGVKDIGLWYNRMRFIIGCLPWQALCAVSDKNTKGMIINIQNRDTAGKWRKMNEEAKAVGVDALGVHEETTAQAGDHEEAGDDDAAAFKAMMKKKAEDTRANAGKGVSDLRADFGVHVYCNHLLFDPAKAYEDYLIPVPDTWPMKLVMGPKGKVMQPYDRTDLCQATNPPSFEQFSDMVELNLNQPNSLPPVICVSDYTQSNDENFVPKLCALVKGGFGSFRVAANSKTFSNPESAAQLFEAIPMMRPEEGAELLDKGTVTVGKSTGNPKTVSITLDPLEATPANPNTRLYVLFYLNKSKGPASMAAEIEATKRILAGTSGKPTPPPAAAAAAGSGRVLEITHEPKASLPVAAAPSAAPVSPPRVDVVMTPTAVKRAAPAQVAELNEAGEEIPQSQLPDEESRGGGGDEPSAEQRKKKKKSSSGGKKKSHKHAGDDE